MVIAPLRQVLKEWRYVVVGRQVIAGSGYLAKAGRRQRTSPRSGMAIRDRGGRAVTPPDAVYVLDVCEADTGLRLLELNPFSGARSL